MAQQIWLLRHGDAESRGSGTDAERRLTARGEQQSRVAGAALAALGVHFSAVLSSPRIRARDTARLAAEPLGVEPTVHEALSGDFGSEQALDLLVGRDDDVRLLLVGHEPDFGGILHDLTGARIHLKKGGVAAVRVQGREGELAVVLRPRELDVISAA
ncbi:MAG: histidine phosphatase family protein [Actinomycetota bacterium]|nr:histidine phosphatase family protein [Actinomycetota bacterium]